MISNKIDENQNNEDQILWMKKNLKEDEIEKY